MGRPKVWTTRPCAVCGVGFITKPHDPKKHCSAACIRETNRRNAIARNLGKDQRGEKGTNWKGDSASRWAMHKRANALKGDGPCERCGKEGQVVHHKDENPWNNAMENLERLCRRCHINHHRSQLKPSQVA